MKSRYLKSLLVLAATAVGFSAVSSGADRRRSGTSPTVATGAPPPAVAPSQGFDRFQLVVERNIFNPNRLGRTRVDAGDKPARVDEISLVGTVRYDREQLAIFDSPDAQYRKAVREGEMLADFKLVRISQDTVELLRGDKPVALKVAQQLRRAEGAEWAVTMNRAAQADPKAMDPGAANTINASRTGEAAAGEIPADASEVLKRLMKKREKQLK
jgi:hypothetical protein